MQVLIMAAGEAKRLRPLTQHKPKTLLPLNDKEILHHILDGCRQNGLTDFYLLTGHGQEYVQAWSRKYTDQHPELSIRHIFNPEYQTKGNIFSMYAAREIFKQDFMLINSDVIFHPKIIGALLKHPRDNVMVLDDYKKLSEEEMKVLLNPDKTIRRINKKLDPSKSHGEYVGILKIHGRHAVPLINSLETVLARDPSLYYEDALQHLMDSGVPFYTVSTDGRPCMEIDTPEDLANAEKMIKLICQ